MFREYIYQLIVTNCSGKDRLYGEMLNKLRVGLIGLGQISEMHLHGYKDLEEIDVVAGADLLQDRVEHVTKRWNIRGYQQYEDMLRKENLDIACVLTPAAAHREVTEKAAEYGVNVLCEKPIAVALNDAKSMIAECRKHGVRLCYAESFRFMPAFMKAKEMIDQGFLGDLFLLMEIYADGKGVRNWKPLGYNHYPKDGPGGGGMGLVDHGIHLVDIFRWLTGSEAVSVFGRGNYSGQSPSTEYLTVAFENKAVGQLVYNDATFSSSMPYEGIFSWGMSWGPTGEIVSGSAWDANPGNVRIHGTEGALRVFHYANKLFFFAEGQRKQVHVLDQPCPANFGLQMKSFVRRLKSDDEPEVTGADGLKALQIILAAYESFATQRIVSIEPTT